MLDLLFSPAFKPFGIALCLMMLLGVLELFSMLFGGVLSSMLESLLPEMDAVDVSAPHDSVLNQFFGWLKLREVPLLMALVVGLLEFGLLGLVLQHTVGALTGSMLPAWLAGVLCFGLLLPLLRFSLQGLGRVMPKDETSAVSQDSLIGRVATITLGQARQGFPAEAKVQDEHGYSHYLMVEPDEADVSFSQGQQVLLVRRISAVYRVIANPLSH